MSETIKQYFPGDSYETPADNKRDLGDRLCFGGSAWFYTIFLKEIYRGSREATAGKYGDAEWAFSSHEIFRILERCGAHFQIDGLQHIREVEGPVVFISNHMSTVETVVFPCIIRPDKPVTFVVKESLETMPIFGPIMRSRNPITVGRTNPREDMQKVLTGGVERLNDGISVILFPQSTRMAQFIPEQFNSLGVKLAKRAGVPVIPVAIKTDFWGNGRLIKDFGPLDRSLTNHIRFGPAMEVTGNGKEQHQAIVDFITANLAVWQGEGAAAAQA